MTKGFIIMYEEETHPLYKSKKTWKEIERDGIK